MISSDFIQNRFNTITTTVSLENWKKLLTLNKKIDDTPNKYKLLFGVKVEKEIKKKTKSKKI